MYLTCKVKDIFMHVDFDILQKRQADDEHTSSLVQAFITSWA